MKQLTFTILLIALLLAGCNVPTAPVVSPADTTTLPVDPQTPQTAESTLPATVETQPESATQPAPEQPTAVHWIAYIGLDGNVWLANPLNGEQRQLTRDGSGLISPGGQEAVVYNSPEWSSDGRLLAYSRQLQTPLPDRMDYTYTLIVYNLPEDKIQATLENAAPNGVLSWQPGKHVLTYHLNVDPNYFTTRGEVDSSKALGLRAWNVDTWDISELVPPQRGYHLANPMWLPDGSRVCFNEVVYYEGMGAFACYDFTASQYFAWERPIGAVSYAPDGQQIAYDYLTYIPNGEERITLNNLQGTAEQSFAPKFENGYSWQPVWSPQGDKIAYTSFDFNANTSKLQVQSLNENYPRELGLFESPTSISWSPDGSQLLLVVGPYDNSQVILVDIASAAVKPLAQGAWPAWQP